MNLTDAMAVIGSLSQTSKGDGSWRSWGIPAQACLRGSDLAKMVGTACRICYAKKGNYRFSGVNAALFRRLDATSDPRWPEAMAVAIRELSHDHFRWFDSGDLQSASHLDQILEVCRRTQSTRHWLPTHEPFIVGARIDALPKNLCVRISADLIEDRPITPTWGLPTSTVHRFKGEPVPAPTGNPKHSIECSAYRRDGRCGRCRACWDPRVRNVSYLKH